MSEQPDPAKATAGEPAAGMPPDLMALLDLASEPSFVLSHRDSGRPAPVVAHVNRTFSELSGSEPGELVGRSARALRGVLRPRAVLGDVIRAATAGEPLQARVELTDRGGRPVALSLRGERLPDRADLYVVWFVSPAAEPKAYAEPGERLRAAAGLTRECFYELAVDLDCRLRPVWTDPRLAEVTGHTAEELAGLGGFFALVVEADRPELQRRNQRLLAGQQTVARYRLRRKDGTLCCVKDTARPEWAPDGEAVVRIVGALLDLSTEKAETRLLPLLEREAQLVAGTLDAFVCLLDAQGHVRWTAGGDAGNSPVGELARRLGGGVGQSLAALLPGGSATAWLDWLDEARESAGPVRFRFPAFPDGPEIEALLAAVGDDLVQVVLREPSRPAVAAEDRGVGIAGVLDVLPEPLLLADPAGRILAANGAFERLLGRQRTELAGSPLLERLVAAPDRAALAEAFETVAGGQEPASRAAANLRCLAKGGERALDLRLSAVLGGDRRGDTVAAVLVEAQRPAQAGAPAAAPVLAGQGEPWFNAIADSVSDGIVTLDPAGTITWLSRSAEAIFDYPREAAVGGSLGLLFAPAAGDPRAFVEGLLAASAERPGRTRELTARRRSGEPIPIEAEATALDYGGRRVVILTVRDITVRRQTEETLKSLAYHDPLTGLANRLLFHDRVSQGIERARRLKQSLTVMLVDLDRFKLINDSLGLDKGDQVLKAVGDRLVGALRKSDTVARLGGDEYMVLLLGTSGAETAAKVAQKLLDSLRPPLRVNGHELTTAASIGISLFPHDGDDADTLVKNADTALSRAKEQGRNHYQFYTEDMNATAFERLMLESRLRKALEQGEFVIHYQPKVSLADGRIVGVEALLRWRHPDLNLVPPSEFIPLAEETGLIVPIGEWVLATACVEVKRWHRMGFEPLDLAVNLSARQFQARNLADALGAAIAASGLPSGSVELELTESVIMRDAAESTRRLRELTALGIRLSVDDFGTGYSSLGYLKSFPISSLKIDRSFVRDVDRDPGGAAIAQAIITLAKGLGLKVVAEGVETPGQMEVLRGFGCEEMQGYLFSRPLPAEEMVRLLREGRRLEV